MWVGGSAVRVSNSFEKNPFHGPVRPGLRTPSHGSDIGQERVSAGFQKFPASWVGEGQDDRTPPLSGGSGIVPVKNIIRLMGR